MENRYYQVDSFRRPATNIYRRPSVVAPKRETKSMQHQPVVAADPAAPAMLKTTPVAPKFQPSATPAIQAKKPALDGFLPTPAKRAVPKVTIASPQPMTIAAPVASPAVRRAMDGMTMKKAAKPQVVASIAPVQSATADHVMHRHDIRRALAEALRETVTEPVAETTAQPTLIAQQFERPAAQAPAIAPSQLDIPEEVLSQELQFAPAVELPTMTVLKSRVGDMLRI